MNEAIELHDSVLDSVEIIDGILIVSLRPAYVHQSRGVPGVDEGSGLVQDIAIEFAGHEMVGDVGDLPTDIFDGDFELDGTVFPNMINLPCDGKPAKLILNLWPDNRRITVSGTSVRVKPLSESTYVEEFKR
jgi:hypothetical protein